MRPKFDRHHHPAESVIQATMERFRTIFTLVDNAHPQRRPTVCNEDVIADVTHPDYGRFEGRGKRVVRSTNDLKTR